MGTSLLPTLPCLAASPTKTSPLSPRLQSLRLDPSPPAVSPLSASVGRDEAKSPQTPTILPEHKSYFSKLPKLDLHSYNEQVVVPGYWRTNTKYEGQQTNLNVLNHNAAHFDVHVEILKYNPADETINGYMKTYGLNGSVDPLQTFFSGEIVNKEHGWITKSYNSDAQIDYNHWSRLEGFQLLVKDKNYEKDLSVIPVPDEKYPYKFMRWKEEFVYPDHRVKQVTGASWQGFYYLCLHVPSSTISGFYYHMNSTLYQPIQLEMQMPSKSNSSALVFM